MMTTKFVFSYLGFVMLLSVAMINCSNDNNNLITPAPFDSSDFRYPFSDGNSWNYTVTTSVSDIRPDSILYHFSEYPLVTIGTATILYDTTINSVVAKCFLDEFTTKGFSFSNRYYYINNDTALILLAQRQQGPSSGILPLKKIRNILPVENTDNLNNLNEVYNNELEVLNDSLFSTLKYPMVTGTEWSYMINGFTTNKKYLGFENVTVPAGTISCMNESIVYSFSPTSIFYNYYSRFGLIKSYSSIDDITYSTVTNPDGIGTFDWKQETAVTSYNIPLE